ncbi:NAD(P)-dependent dehydrogenase (short-subunit alcohol dehydrogenase family) [Bradyrhizobium sp. S3.2.12]
MFSEAGWLVISCARQPFDAARCPWDSEGDSYIKVDLSDHRTLPRVIAEIKECLAGAPLHGLVNNAGNSPKTPNGARLTSLATSVDTWMSVFHLNLVAPILLAQGLFDELKAASGAIVNVTSIAGSRVHPFAGTAYATSKAALACLTRNGARLRLTWHSRKWGRVRRNQDGHFAACHGSTSCAKDPTSPSGYTRRGRQGHFLPMFRCRKLCHWRRKSRSMADNTCDEFAPGEARLI